MTKVLLFLLMSTSYAHSSSLRNVDYFQVSDIDTRMPVDRLLNVIKRDTSAPYRNPNAPEYDAIDGWEKRTGNRIHIELAGERLFYVVYHFGTGFTRDVGKELTKLEKAHGLRTAEYEWQCGYDDSACLHRGYVCKTGEEAHICRVYLVNYKDADGSYRAKIQWFDRDGYAAFWEAKEKSLLVK